MAQIIFTNSMGVPEEFAPKPATSLVPDWYKTMESYISGEKKPTGEGNTTQRRTNRRGGGGLPPNTHANTSQTTNTESTSKLHVSP